MATATATQRSKVEVVHPPTASPGAFRMAARAFLRFPGVEVVWLAVRESREQTAIIRSSEGARSSSALGLQIEPTVGVGGAALLSGEPWHGELDRNGTRVLSPEESTFLTAEGAKHLMVVALRSIGLRGEARVEGVAYAASRRRVVWTEKTIDAARRTGERVARPVRDAQRIIEVTQRWQQLWVELVASRECADRCLDQVARQIATDVRSVLRSGIGIVFRLDAASGALHSLAQDGEVIPGEIIPAVRRGQVLPAGCGCAGRAVVLRKPFVAQDYGSGSVVVPPIMAEAVAKLPTLTTMSPDGAVIFADGRSRVFRQPKDARLGRILQQVETNLQAFWTPDLANDPRLASPNGNHPPEPIEGRAVLVAPIRISGTLLGLLGVSADTGRAFTDTDVELVQALADQAALGIANARAYDELQLSNVQLLQHEKLVAMGRLTSALAHELRNPLQNVVALTSELAERSRGTLQEHPEFVDFPDYLRRAHSEAKRAADIVDRLLDHIRERRPTFDTVDLRNIVADAVAIVTPAAAVCKCRLTVVTDDMPVLVRADAIMLRQVVLNLLNNAIDAADQAGEISVHAGLERTDIGVSRAVVSVSDTGRGLAPEHLPRVFDPFFTTKDVGHGVGLGLAICQSFIEQHGGSIRADSPGLGKGTTVRFELPVPR
jgi:signal transduction histidine kinase